MAGAAAHADDEQATSALAHRGQAAGHRVHLAPVDRGRDLADGVEVAAGMLARLHAAEGTRGG